MNETISMTNEELMQAIAQTHELIGRSTGETCANLELHLEALLNVQIMRAQGVRITLSRREPAE